MGRTGALKEDPMYRNSAPRLVYEDKDKAYGKNFKGYGKGGVPLVEGDDATAGVDTFLDGGFQATKQKTENETVGDGDGGGSTLTAESHLEKLQKLQQEELIRAKVTKGKLRLRVLDIT